MNALELVERVRSHGGELAIEDNRLVVNGPRELPEPLLADLRAHKAEVMIALGVPMNRTVASILDEIRPYLSAPLRTLPDGKLLALVNWSIIAAWEKAIRSVGK